MFSSQDIYNLFQVNYIALGANIKEIDHKESLIRPKPAGNSINWVLGHILVSRGLILKMMNEKPVLSDVQGSPYKRGSVVGINEILLPFESLVDRFNKSQKILKQSFESLTQEQLSESDEANDVEWQQQPLGDKLIFLQFHEAYHIGQVGLLRRIIGKEGAIA